MEDYQEEGKAIGIILILIGGLFLGCGFLFDINKYIALSMFFIYLGILFFISYFFEIKSFLFKSLMWVCRNLSLPSTPKMALVYAAIFTVSGILGLIYN